MLMRKALVREARSRVLYQRGVKLAGWYLHTPVLSRLFPGSFLQTDPAILKRNLLPAAKFKSLI